MLDILHNIQQNIDALQLIVASLITLAVSIVVGIKKVKDAYAQGSKDILSVLEKAVPAIAAQESLPLPNELKNSNVSQQIIDLVPDKTKKKLKLDSLISAGNVVSTIYSFVKPLVKRK